MQEDSFFHQEFRVKIAKKKSYFFRRFLSGEKHIWPRMK